MTPAQVELLDSVLDCGEYADALSLLDENRALIDDELLHELLMHSAWQYEHENYETALALADLGVVVSESATPATRIDLCLAAANAQVGRKDYADSAAFLDRAMNIAEDSGVGHHVPMILALSCQLALQSDENDAAKSIALDAMKRAQDPASDLDDDEFFKILLTAARVLRDAGMPADDAAGSMLGSVTAENRARLPAKVRDVLGFETEWQRARIAWNVLLDESFEWSPLDVLREVTGRARKNAPPPPDRPATNVFIDRVIGVLPMQPVMLTLDGLRRDLDGVATLVHEFVHYYALSGGLGAYFSTLTAGLYVVEAVLSAGGAVMRSGEGRLRLPDTAVLSATGQVQSFLQKFVDGQAKLECLWTMWEPWAEGLALFAELDMQITPSDDESLPPTSMMLFGIPNVSHDTYDTDDAANPKAPPRQDGSYAVEKKLDETRDLQNEARQHRIASGIIGRIDLDRATDGNEDAYFLGRSFIHALWLRWSDRAEGFRSSAQFVNVLIWLTLSAFDDLLPSMELPLGDFRDALVSRFAEFLAKLAALDGDTLDRITTPDRTRAPHDGNFDLWNFIRTGGFTRTAVLCQTRADALQHELMPAAIYGNAERRALLEQTTTSLLDYMLRGDTVHLIAQVVVDFRIVSGSRAIFVAGRTAASGRVDAWVRTLSEDEYAQLAAQKDVAEPGRALFSQVLLAVQHPVLRRAFSMVSVFQYGSAVFVWKPNTTADATMDEIVRAYVAPDRQRIRATIGQPASFSRRDRKSLRADDAADVLGIDRITEIVDGLPAIVARVFLEPLLGDDSALIEEVREHRLLALLSSDLLDRNADGALLREIARAPAGIEVTALSAALRRPVQGVEETIRRIIESARRAGQEPVSRRGNLVVYNGLRLRETA